MDSKNFDRAIQFIELGRYNAAIPYLENSISEDPNNWEGKYYLAVCHYNEGDTVKASQLADGLMHDMPNDADVLFLKARIALEQDREQEAEAFVDEAISINPFNADFFGFKAGILLHEKKYEEGLLKINEGLKVEANNRYCLNIRAQLLTKLDRVDEADETVENILYDNPEDAYSHANVGWVALENGNHKKALEHFRQSLQFDPNFEYAREGMSTALKSKNLVYKWYMKYAFWISKQSSRNQWIFIIGLYLVYRFSVKLLSAGGLSYLAVPLMVVYLLFALGGWLMEPMSNAILNFDSYGKYLLSTSQKTSGYIFGGLLLAGLLSILTFYIFGVEYTLTMAITFICTLVPLPRAFLLASKRGKSLGIGYGTLMLIVGLLGPFFIDMLAAQFAVFIMMVAYTWIGNYIEG